MKSQQLSCLTSKDIVGKNKAFAIISRLAKSLGNSIGIKSTTIICDRWLVYYEIPFIPISDAHAIGVMQSYGMTGVHSEAAPC